MKTFFALILSLFLSTSMAVETCDYSNKTEQQESSYIEDVVKYFDELIAEYDGEDQVINNEERWLIKLSNELLLSDDININITALSHLNSFNGYKVNSETNLPILDKELKLSILNKAIESESASTPSLLGAMVMCEESGMDGVCDVGKFNQKLFLKDPENIIIYLNELEVAVDNADEELIGVILQQMSEGKYSRNFSPISSEFYDAVDEYLQINRIDDINYFESVMDLLDKDLGNDKELMIKNSVLSTYYISAFFNIPSLHPLIKACEQFQKDARNCQSIANTLIEHSDTNIMTMMGYGLNVKINEVFGDDNSLAQSQIAEEAFGTYIMCLSQNYLFLDEHIDISDSEFLKIMVQGKHEGINFELAALYLYDKYRGSGRGDLVDPRSCGLRYHQVQ